MYENVVNAYLLAEAEDMRKGIKHPERVINLSMQPLLNHRIHAPRPHTLMYDRVMLFNNLLAADPTLQKKRMSAAIEKVINAQALRKADDDQERSVGNDEGNADNDEHYENVGYDRTRSIPDQLNAIMEMLADIGGQLQDAGGMIPAGVVGVGVQLVNIGIGLASGPGYRPPMVDDATAEKLLQDPEDSIQMTGRKKKKKKKDRLDGLIRGQDKDKDEDKAAKGTGCFAKLFCCLNLI